MGQTSLPSESQEEALRQCIGRSEEKGLIFWLFILCIHVTNVFTAPSTLFPFVTTHPTTLHRTPVTG